MAELAIRTSIKITGVSPLLARLRGLQGPELKRTVERDLKRTARTVIAPRIAAATPHRYGGHAGRYPTKGLLSKRSKITARNVRTRSGEFVAISIKPRVFVEHWVVQGTKAHLIAASGVFGAATNQEIRAANRAGGARALFFHGVFASQVRHPGARPNDYIHRAAQGAESAILDQLSKALMKEPR